MKSIFEQPIQNQLEALKTLGARVIDDVQPEFVSVNGEWVNYDSLDVELLLVAGTDDPEIVDLMLGIDTTNPH